MKTLKSDFHTLPAEPMLLTDAVVTLRDQLLGSAIGVANARSGRNARKLAHVRYQMEPDVRFFEFAASQASPEFDADPGPWSGTVWSSEDGKITGGTQLLSDRTVRHIRAAASGTGLPDGALSALVVDHFQTEHDPGAVISEARRVLAPGGRLAFVDYGRPNVAEMGQVMDAALRGLYIQYNGLAQNMDEFFDTHSVQADYGFEDLTIDSCLAACSATWPELSSYLRQTLTVPCESCPGAPLEGSLDALGAFWGDPDQPRQVWFQATILMMAMPG